MDDRKQKDINIRNNNTGTTSECIANKVNRMELEFEIERIAQGKRKIGYSITRKGHPVGFLELDEEPYGQPEARMKLMTLHKEIKKTKDLSKVIITLQEALQEIKKDKTKIKGIEKYEIYIRRALVDADTINRQR